jgi:hypothetical protein
VRGDVLVMLTGIDESTAMKFTLQFQAGHAAHINFHS